MNCVLRDEERANRIEANLNVHLQSYAKNVGRIQDDFSRVVEKINSCDDRVDVHQQRHVDQESFNRAILERMQELEATIEGQTERIVSLEEEVATLRWRKECKSLGARAYGNGCLHAGNIAGFGRKFFQCSDQIHFIHISHVTSTFASNVIANNISFTFEM